MAQSKKNFFISYLLLVGMPLLGLIGALEVGRGLIPPVSVGGAWDLQADFSVAGAPSCDAWLDFRRPVALEISQSGGYLTLTLRGQRQVSLQGTLDRMSLVTDSSSPVGSRVENRCSDQAGLSVRAEVNPKANPRTISGILSMDGCPSCGSVNFRAVPHAFPAGNRNE
jgi:hypothetical protein